MVIRMEKYNNNDMARWPRPTVSEKPSCKMKLVQFHLHKKKKEKKEIIYLRTHR